MRKLKILIFCLVLVICSLFMFACGNATDLTDSAQSSSAVTGSKDLKINELEKELQDSENIIDSLKEEIYQYQDFINMVKNNASDEGLLILAKSQWKYTLKVDGNPMPEDGSVVLDKTDFDVVITEMQPPHPVLPSEIHSKGKISGNYFDHIEFLNITPNTNNPSAGGFTEAMLYGFYDVPQNATVRFRITDELRARLGLKTNNISILIKGENKDRENSISIPVNGTNGDLLKIAHLFEEKKMERLKDAAVQDEARIKDYKIDKLEVTDSEGLVFQYCVSCSILPATDRFILAGSGEKGQNGWIVDICQFVVVSRIGDEYKITKTATSPILKNWLE